MRVLQRGKDSVPPYMRKPCKKAALGPSPNNHSYFWLFTQLKGDTSIISHLKILSRNRRITKLQTRYYLVLLPELSPWKSMSLHHGCWSLTEMMNLKCGYLISLFFWTAVKYETEVWTANKCVSEFKSTLHVMAPRWDWTFGSWKNL